MEKYFEHGQRPFLAPNRPVVSSFFPVCTKLHGVVRKTDVYLAAFFAALFSNTATSAAAFLAIALALKCVRTRASTSFNTRATFGFRSLGWMHPLAANCRKLLIIGQIARETVAGGRQKGGKHKGDDRSQQLVLPQLCTSCFRHPHLFAAVQSAQGRARLHRKRRPKVDRRTRCPAHRTRASSFWYSHPSAGQTMYFAFGRCVCLCLGEGG